MPLNPRLLALLEGVRLRIFAVALVRLLAVAAGIGRLAVAAIVIVKVILEGASFSTFIKGKQGEIYSDKHTLSPLLTPEVRFEDVDFAYNQGKRPALHQVSFNLAAGETLGLVGSSGAGKSTVVWLMLRFFDPQQGRVLLGGHDLRELPLAFLRRHVAVVTQDTYLFHGTVADNLRFGNPDATQEELEVAAKAANAHQFISALPSGYDTPVGERATCLSGGQYSGTARDLGLCPDYRYCQDHEAANGNLSLCPQAVRGPRRAGAGDRRPWCTYPSQFGII